MENSDDNYRLDQLDGIRLIGILLIVFSHLEFLYIGEKYSYSSLYQHFLRNPTFGVDYFFMLSGFGLYIKYNTVNPEKTGIGFALKNTQKIYLLYIISMIICVPYQLLIFGINLKSIIVFGVGSILSVFLVQSAFGHQTISHFCNGVCWFLSCITMLYAIFHLLRKIVIKFKERIKILLSITIILNSLLYSFLVVVENKRVFGIHFNDLSYGTPYIRVFYFFMGIIAGSIYLSNRDKSIKRTNTTLLELIVAVIFVIYYFARYSIREMLIDSVGLLGSTIVQFIDIVLCFGILIIAAFGNGFIVNNLKKISSLGRLSMYLFLFHYPVRLYIGYLFDAKNIFWGDATGIIELIIIIVLSFGLSYIAYKLHLKYRKFKAY